MTEPLPAVPPDSPPLAAPAAAPTDDVRRDLTARVTRLMAALALARTEFPDDGDLPRLAPVPYNHLGHQVLLDYQRLAMILWGAVHEMQEAARKSRRRYLVPLAYLACVLVGVGVGVVAYTRSDLPSDNPVPGALVALLPIAFGIIIGACLYAALRLRVEKVAAEVRARNLRLLLEEEDPASERATDREARARNLREVLRGKGPAAQFEAGVAGKVLAAWGDASLGQGVCPVLVLTSDDDPFPGFGRRQASQLFVCRPGDEKEPPALSPEALSADLSETLTALARNSGIPHVGSGNVVLIDGRTLRVDSPWLQARGSDGEPPLFVPDARLATVRTVDPCASVRVCTCIQVLLPEHLMCVTFFVRTFFAGNSAACEVSVATLGPPIADWDYVRERLRLYDREQHRPKTQGIGYDANRVTPLGARLANVRFALESPSRVFTSRARAFRVRDLDPFDKEALHHEKWQVKRIVEAGEQWPGIYTTQANWRERYSLTFTTDFFGNTESRAVLKTLYDRICRSALGRLKELGFDVRDYQDESGHFTIKADAIEHLVVGERVYMERKPNEKAGAGEVKPGPAEVKA